jgi:TPR repeat protein
MNPIFPPTANHDPAQVEAHHDAPSSPSVLLTASQCVVASTHDGFGISQSKSVHDIEVEADQGDAAAQCNYGVMLSHGEGISMNKSLAAHYLKLSADQGNARAQCEYGFMLLHGEGIVG